MEKFFLIAFWPFVDLKDRLWDVIAVFTERLHPIQFLIYGLNAVAFGIGIALGLRLETSVSLIEVIGAWGIGMLIGLIVHSKEQPMLLLLVIARQVLLGLIIGSFR